MTSGKFFTLLIAFVICYLAIGIPYWQLSYSSVSLPDSLYGIGLLLMFVCTVLFCSRGMGFLWAATIMGLCAPLVVATRIVVDIARDSSTHNLFPFELAIAIIVGFSVAGLGAAVGVLFRRIFKTEGSK